MKKSFLFLTVALMMAQGLWANIQHNEVILGISKTGKDSLYEFNLTDRRKSSQIYAGSTSTTKVSDVHVVTINNKHHWVCGIVDEKMTLWHNGTLYKQWTPNSSYPNIRQIGKMIPLSTGDVAICGTIYRKNSPATSHAMLWLSSDMSATLLYADNGGAHSMTEDLTTHEVITGVQTTNYQNRPIVYLYRNKQLKDSCYWASDSFFYNDMEYDSDYGVLCLAGNLGTQGDQQGVGSFNFYGDVVRSDVMTRDYHTPYDDSDDASCSAVCMDKNHKFWYAGYSTGGDYSTLCVWEDDPNQMYLVAHNLETTSAWHSVKQMVYHAEEHAFYILENNTTQSNYVVWKYDIATAKFSKVYTSALGEIITSICINTYTDYEVEINDIAVTSANADDILGNGRMRYIASANALTVVGSGRVTVDHIKTADNLTIGIADGAILDVDNALPHNPGISAKGLAIKGGVLRVQGYTTCISAQSLYLRQTRLSLGHNANSSSTTVGIYLTDGAMTVDSSYVNFVGLAPAAQNIGSVTFAHSYPLYAYFNKIEKTFIMNGVEATDFEILQGDKYDVEYNRIPFSSNVSTVATAHGSVRYDQAGKSVEIDHLDAPLTEYVALWSDEAVEHVHLLGTNTIRHGANSAMYFLENNVEITGDTLIFVDELDLGANAITLEGAYDQDLSNLTIACSYFKSGSFVQNYADEGDITFAGDYFEAANVYDFSHVVFDNTKLVEPAGGSYDETKQMFVNADGTEATKVVIASVRSGIHATTSVEKPVKTLENGQVIIRKNGQRFSVLGVEL